MGRWGGGGGYLASLYGARNLQVLRNRTRHEDPYRTYRVTTYIECMNKE
jgi:hypothetical protein